MEFILRDALPEDLDGVMAVMESAVRLTKPKEWFISDDADYVGAHLKGKDGFVLVAETGGIIAAFFMVHYPGLSEKNLGHVLGYSEEEMLRTAHMDSAAVLPEYRGHRLQARLCGMAEEKLRGTGYRHLLCTVHPDNRFSLSNMLNGGYEIKATILRYGGLRRHVLLKEL